MGERSTVGEGYFGENAVWGREGDRGGGLASDAGIPLGLRSRTRQSLTGTGSGIEIESLN